MNDKVVGLPPSNPSELRKVLDTLKRGMPDQLELLTMLARMDFAKFEAYIAAGFKPEQAIDLLKAEKIKAHV